MFQRAFRGVSKSYSTFQLCFRGVFGGFGGISGALGGVLGGFRRHLTKLRRYRCDTKVLLRVSNGLRYVTWSHTRFQ